MAESVAQTFGSDWTEIKLDALTDYISQWNKILSKYPYFKRVYIDAFAGSGEREQNGKVHLGSPLRVMSLNAFDEYHFIDGNSTNCDSLRSHFESRTGQDVHIYHDDANKWIKEHISDFNWSKTRGIMFLDPFAMQLDYNTLEQIAEQTTGLDLWMLFPASALIRTLPRKSYPLQDWWPTLNRFWGDESWREFYKEEEESLFNFDYTGAEGEDPLAYETVIARQSHMDILKGYRSRLEKIFPAVCGDFGMLQHRNHLLFLLIFVTTAPKPSSQGAAMNIAKHLIKAINTPSL